MPYEEPIIPGQKAVPTPPVIIESHNEYEVESVVDSHLRQGKLEFLIHWKGYTIEHDSWEPEVNLKNSKKYINEFYKRRPSAPRCLNASIFAGYAFKEIPRCENVDVRETIAHINDYAPGFHNHQQNYEHDAQDQKDDAESDGEEDEK